MNLHTHRRRIVIGAAVVRHHHHAGLQIEVIQRNCAVEIVGKGRDTAATRQMVADERDAPERAHWIVSMTTNSSRPGSRPPV